MKLINTKKFSESQFQEVITLLKAGGVLIYPTDTVYGLGCDAANRRAVKKVFLIKGRLDNKPLPNIVAGLTMAKKYAKFSPLALRLARQYWPGALNLVLPVKYTTARVVTARRGKIGLRVPKNGLALRLSRALKRPLVSTSANVSGKLPCYNINEIRRQFEGRRYQPDIILDGGQLSRKNEPSTVAEVKGNKVKILRAGGVQLNNITK
jgi:L-threonylcarbamoyladenylate synthase